MILDFEWNRVKVVLLTDEHGSAIIFPVMFEVIFNLLLEFDWGVFALTKGLETDVLYQGKPLIEALFTFTAGVLVSDV